MNFADLILTLEASDPLGSGTPSLLLRLPSNTDKTDNTTDSTSNCKNHGLLYATSAREFRDKYSNVKIFFGKN